MAENEGEGRRPDVLALLLLAAAWGAAVWIVYAILPGTHRTIRDFNMLIDPASRAVLDHAWLVAPILAVASLIVLLAARPTLAGRLALLAVPLLLAGGCWLISQHYLGKLAEGLAR